MASNHTETIKQPVPFPVIIQLFVRLHFGHVCPTSGILILSAVRKCSMALIAHSRILVVSLVKRIITFFVDFFYINSDIKRELYII